MRSRITAPSFRFGRLGRFGERRVREVLGIGLLGVAATTSSACSADAEPEGEPRAEADAGPGQRPIDQGNGGSFDPSTVDAGSNVGSDDGCESTTRLVYTIDSSRTLRRFDPPSTSFTTVGVLACPSSGNPNSMAIARDGTAWVLYNDGHLFKVATKTAACEATTFEPNQQGMNVFGMGFASDAADSASETLFVGTHPPSNKLGKLALDTLKISTIGSFEGVTARSELTGTGSGQLFALFETSGTNPFFPSGTPFTVAEVAKTSGQILSKAPQETLPRQPTNFAVAAWGGDFWLFVGKDVHRYEPAKKKTTKATTVDFVITGAGVSTCAPHAVVK